MSHALALDEFALADEHGRIMVEWMQRAGYSEREIVAAVERELGRRDDRPRPAEPPLRRRLRRVVGRR
jgi:hypothetical protein